MPTYRAYALSALMWPTFVCVPSHDVEVRWVRVVDYKRNHDFHNGDIAASSRVNYIMEY